MTTTKEAGERVAAEVKAIELPDGRLLAWQEHGPPDGVPVVFCHGTPSSRREWNSDPSADTSGARVIAVDRPGYGLSTYQPRRRLRDWPDDVNRLADHLRLDRFAVLGASGGGPHALACARFLGDRVPIAATVGGFCALDPHGKAGAAAQTARLCAASTWVGTAIFAGMFFVRQRWPDAVLGLWERSVPPSDLRVLARPDVRSTALTRSSPTAARAASQDFALFMRDWEFRLEDITTPVHIWQGTDDFNVPRAHADYMASALPNATLHLCEGEGHLLMHDHAREVLAQLVAS